jgi:hypothetical protein
MLPGSRLFPPQQGSRPQATSVRGAKPDRLYRSHKNMTPKKQSANRFLTFPVIFIFYFIISTKYFKSNPSHKYKQEPVLRAIIARAHGSPHAHPKQGPTPADPAAMMRKI